MTDEVTRRYNELRAEVKANEKEWEDLNRQRVQNERRGEELASELHKVTVLWLKGQPLTESWKYWVRRADRRDVTIYYAGEDVELVDTDFLDRDEKAQYEEDYEKARVRDVPNDAVILAVVAACEEDERFN